MDRLTVPVSVREGKKRGFESKQQSYFCVSMETVPIKKKRKERTSEIESAMLTVAAVASSLYPWLPKRVSGHMLALARLCFFFLAVVKCLRLPGRLTGSRLMKPARVIIHLCTTSCQH